MRVPLMVHDAHLGRSPHSHAKCGVCGESGHDSIHCCVSEATVRITDTMNRTCCKQAELNMLQTPLVAIVPSEEVTSAFNAYLGWV